MEERIQYYLYWICCLVEKNQKLEQDIKQLTKELLETNQGVLALVEEYEKINKDRYGKEQSGRVEHQGGSRDKERERALIQAMVQADKMASLGQLTAGIAHEINNPTTYIRGNIELLKRYWDCILQEIRLKDYPRLEFIGEELPYVLDSMLKGTERIAQIVNGLKCFSRQEKMHFVPIHLKELVEDTYQLVKHEFVKYNITFINRITEEKCTIIGSKLRLEQVFINLFLNSLRAIKEGTQDGEVEIKVHHVTSEYVSVGVKDNGCGISKENLEKVFNPFFTTYFNTGGTGLGLSIVYGIIKEHGGNIEVFSRENEGTEFIITLKKLEEKGVMENG